MRNWNVCTPFVMAECETFFHRILCNKKLSFIYIFGSFETEAKAREHKLKELKIIDLVSIFSLPLFAIFFQFFLMLIDS